jgi:hypothetical protein
MPAISYTNCWVGKRIQHGVVLVFAVLVLGCRASTPENASAAVTLMTKYSQSGQYDRAIDLGQEWLKKHSDDTSHATILYDQIAITFLMKASKDTGHKQEWMQQGVDYYGRARLAPRHNGFDIELYTVGRGLESAGDMSTDNKCLYYGQAIKDFEHQVPFIQGESYTAYGQTVPLATIRQANEKAIQRVTEKFAREGCK